jgi:hypothetical protein
VDDQVDGPGEDDPSATSRSLRLDSLLARRNSAKASWLVTCRLAMSTPMAAPIRRLLDSAVSKFATWFWAWARA